MKRKVNENKNIETNSRKREREKTNKKRICTH